MMIVDIENCRTAKLYDIGRIQAYGALAAIDSTTGLIVTCSENFAAVTGIASEQLLGRHWSEFIDAADMKLLVDSSGQSRPRFWQLNLLGTPYFITGHSDGLVTIVEIEPINSLTSYDSNSRIAYLEELARMAALQISGLTALNVEKTRSVLRLELARIEHLVRTAPTPALSLTDRLADLMRVFKGDSVLLSMDGNDYAQGTVNGNNTLPTLWRWLAGHANNTCWHTNKITGSLQQFPELTRCASGMLYMPLGSGNYLVVLRNEHIENLIWAGRYQQTEDLTLRASFEGWMEQTRGMAPEWDATEIEAALQFSHNLSSFFGNLAIMMLDLDSVKEVNDTWGHAAGDELLCLAAERLSLLLRENDTVARLGGDEFALIQHAIRSPAERGARGYPHRGRTRPVIRAEGQHGGRRRQCRGSAVSGPRRGRRGADGKSRRSAL